MLFTYADALDGIRTHTGRILSPLALPVGLRGLNGQPISAYLNRLRSGLPCRSLSLAGFTHPRRTRDWKSYAVGRSACCPRRWTEDKPMFAYPCPRRRTLGRRPHSAGIHSHALLDCVTLIPTFKERCRVPRIRRLLRRSFPRRDPYLSPLCLPFHHLGVSLLSIAHEARGSQKRGQNQVKLRL